jgi:hypothetical protein
VHGLVPKSVFPQALQQRIGSLAAPVMLPASDRLDILELIERRTVVGASAAG